MDYFPTFEEPVFHVPSQMAGKALGGCLTSNLATVRLQNGLVLSLRLVELVPNKVQTCRKCHTKMKPDQHGVCKKCYSTLCPKCGKCQCGQQNK